MRLAALTAFSLFILALSAGCGDGPLRPTDEGDYFTGDSAGGDTAPCRWWLEDCGDSHNPLIGDKDQPMGDYDFRGDLEGGDQEPENLLATLAAGIWSGEIPYGTGSNGRRMLGVLLYPDGKLVHYINYYGPSQNKTEGTWEATDNTTLVLTLPDETITWTEVSVVERSTLSYVDPQQREITLNWDFTYPEHGLVAEVFAYSEDYKDQIEIVDSWFFGSFDYSGVLSLTHGTTIPATCYDWAFGVTNFRISGGNDFAINHLPAFDRFGGSRCTAVDRFAVMIYGSIDLPPGFSSLRFKVDNGQVDDAGLVFVGSGVLSAENADDAVICSADYGTGQPNCYYFNNKYIGGTEIKLDAGPEGGTFPIEILLLEITDKVYMELEMDVGADGNYGDIPIELISEPHWWE